MLLCHLSIPQLWTIGNNATQLTLSHESNSNMTAAEDLQDLYELEDIGKIEIKGRGKFI